MPPLLYPVTLSAEERSWLKAVVRDRDNSTRRRNRARILLKSADGQTDQAIAEALGVSRTMVVNTRRRHCQKGLEATLRRHRAPIPRAPKLDAAAALWLLELARSEPPEGRNTWSLRLLAERVVAMGHAASFSPESVRLVLKRLAPDWAGIRVSRRRRRPTRHAVARASQPASLGLGGLRGNSGFSPDALD